jgi:8-oxo-dGTP pyrophosphatase MutT (NUDIX family)
MLRDFPLARDSEHATTFLRALEDERADRLHQKVPVSAPRAASTVALVRDGAQGPEAFLMRRTSSMAFAARMHVFPGGGLDPRDGDADVPWAGPDLGRWADAMVVSDQEAAGLLCAAVRELFEESGVLLAGPTASTVVSDLSDPSWEDDRRALLARTLPLSELLRRRGLVLRSDLLRAWAHWCTPVFEPRRFDTWFFVAALPAGQRARHVGSEADHADWVPARSALDAAARGEIALMPPTRVTLEEVAAHPDVASVLSVPRRVGRVMPWLARVPDDGVVIRVDLDGRGGGRPGPASGLEAPS